METYVRITVLIILIMTAFAIGLVVGVTTNSVKHNYIVAGHVDIDPSLIGEDGMMNVRFNPDLIKTDKGKPVFTVSIKE